MLQINMSTLGLCGYDSFFIIISITTFSVHIDIPDMAVFYARIFTTAYVSTILSYNPTLSLS